MQRELRALGYVPGRRGVYDARTGRAILAFRKVSGLPRTTVADRAVFRRMAAGGGRFKIRYPGHGKHVEADLSLQVLALIDHGRVQRIYPTSSGKPSTPTVLGHYRFYSKTPGFNSHQMYFSNYFIGGYAIHGYYDVPVYNASHGCLRDARTPTRGRSTPGSGSATGSTSTCRAYGLPAAKRARKPPPKP